MTTPPARMSRALSAWKALNDRQQGTLGVIFQLDQEAEESRRRAGGRGEFDRSPASAWRAIDFALDPSLLGMTEMQRRLEHRGWHNQGNGSTIAALAKRGLLGETSRPVPMGIMLQVRLTREGRAAARAGLAMPATPKAALSRRSWEVLVFLWKAGLRDSYLQWGHSATIENVLIGKHVPPLAERVPRAPENRHRGGYRITDRGRWFYREFYPQHAAAHPGIAAPHPDGAGAEPWPPRADEILTLHRQLYRALCAQHEAAEAARQAAGAEAAAGMPDLPGVLPEAVAGQARARHALWASTARQRADLASAHAGDTSARAARAARGYAAAALAAFRAAVLHTGPLDVLGPPGDTGDDWDEQRLDPPAETGIHAIDAEAMKLHADAAGAPLPRRGPAPARQRRRRFTPLPTRPEPPGSKHAALADFLCGHTTGGALSRRLHPPRPEETPPP